jgi:hypothetical protein
MSERFTAHDVRKLHLCSECGKLGAYGHELATKIDAPLVLCTGRKKYTHPGCMRIEHLVLLSQSELDEVRLCDVSAQTMETILLVTANNSSRPGRFIGSKALGAKGVTRRVRS